MTERITTPGIAPQFAAVHERFFRTTSTHELVQANPEAYARVLKRQREALGLTQREAASMCGVSQMTIWQGENQDSTPTRLFLAKVMDGLGINREDIEAEVWAIADEMGPPNAA